MPAFEEPRHIIIHHKKIRCCKCKNEVTETAVRACPHPAVIRTYSEPNVCLYCCKRKPCKYFRLVPYSGVCECLYTENF
jgi:hypothetical protein